MKFKREDIIRETALIQRGLTRISKSPLNIINYFILGIGIFIIITLVQDNFIVDFGQKGLFVLTGLTLANYIFIFLYSFAYFSRVISEEKQSKTMTLLRLTPVRPTNIFFGKLLPPFINLMQILIFQLPLVVLMVTLGGVNLEQILSIYLMLVLTSCLFAVIGIWVSSSSLENWLAYFNFLFISFLLVLAYGGVQMMRYKKPMKEFAQYLSIENPISKAYYILFAPTKEVAEIGLTVLIYSIIIVIGLMVAYKSFLKNLDVEEYGHDISERKGDLKAKSISFGNLPILQKEYHFGCGGKKGQVLICGLLILMGILFYFSERNKYSYYDELSVLTKIALIQLSCLALFLIYVTGNSFKKEFIDSTWDSILITPLSAKQIINQKILGSLKFITPLVVAILIILLVNFQELQKDYRYLIREFPAIWILPMSLCASISTCIYFQLFEKFSTMVIGMFVSGTTMLLIIVVSTSNSNERNLAIIAINLLMLWATVAFYKLSIRTIDQQINLKSKD